MSITRILIELLRPTPTWYRRPEFREYVASLPMSEPMTRGTLCPIATYMKISSCSVAAEFDRAVARYIDDAVNDTFRSQFWQALTPLAVLDAIDVIDEQEEFAAHSALRGLTPYEHRLRLEASVVAEDELIRLRQKVGKPRVIKNFDETTELEPPCPTISGSS